MTMPYIPTNYIDEQPPDLSAETLNKSEQQLKYVSDMVYNKNLLLNWDFRNPVNRNNILSGSVRSTTGYFFDKWEQHMGSLTWTDGVGITTAAGTTWFVQYLGNSLVAGKTYELSALINGTTYSGTITANSSIEQGVTVKENVALTLGYSGGQWYLGVVTYASAIINALKLERGSVSTLAYDAPAIYAEEYAKCVQYDKTTGVYVGTDSKIGEIKEYIGTDLGADWGLCNGAGIDPSLYPILFDKTNSLNSISTKRANNESSACYYTATDDAGNFYKCSLSGSTVYMYKYNSTSHTWSSISGPPNSWGTANVAYGDGKLIVYGTNTSGTGQLYYTTDFSSWLVGGFNCLPNQYYSPKSNLTFIGGWWYIITMGTSGGFQVATLWSTNNITSSNWASVFDVAPNSSSNWIYYQAAIFGTGNYVCISYVISYAGSNAYIYYCTRYNRANGSQATVHSVGVTGGATLYFQSGFYDKTSNTWYAYYRDANSIKVIYNTNPDPTSAWTVKDTGITSGDMFGIGVNWGIVVLFTGSTIIYSKDLIKWTSVGISSFVTSMTAYDIAVNSKGFFIAGYVSGSNGVYSIFLAKALPIISPIGAYAYIKLK